MPANINTAAVIVRLRKTDGKDPTAYEQGEIEGTDFAERRATAAQIQDLETRDGTRSPGTFGSPDFTDAELTDLLGTEYASKIADTDFIDGFFAGVLAVWATVSAAVSAP